MMIAFCHLKMITFAVLVLIRELQGEGKRNEQVCPFYNCYVDKATTPLALKVVTTEIQSA